MLTASIPCRSASSTAAWSTRRLVSGVRRSVSVSASGATLIDPPNFSSLTSLHRTDTLRNKVRHYDVRTKDSIREETTLTDRSIEQATASGAAVPSLPPRWFIRAAWVAHRAIYRFTGGRRGPAPPKPGGPVGYPRPPTP